MKKPDDDAWLVAYLLGWVEDEATMPEKVAYAIKVVREIRKQLAERDAQGVVRWPEQEKKAAPASQQLGLGESS